MAAITSAAPSHAVPPARVDGWQRTHSADGTPIAWCALGPSPTAADGSTPVVCCNGIACSTGYWTSVVADLTATRPVVLWDYRAHGRSGAPASAGATAIDDLMADLTAVFDAADIDRAVLVGHSFGVQVALEAAHRMPGTAAAVVAIAGAAGAPLTWGAARTGVDPLDLVERAHARRPDRAAGVWRAWWRSPVPHLLARALGGSSRAAPRPVMRSYYEHVSTRDVATLLAMLRTMQAHDASGVVRDLEVPLLALAGDADKLTPLPVMAKLALAASDGELAVCHGGTHTLLAERPGWVVDQLRPLLDRVDIAGAGRHAIATGA
jgi:pimeloyl-ACP methyl ester carboxylesterase